MFDTESKAQEEKEIKKLKKVTWKNDLSEVRTISPRVIKESFAFHQQSHWTFNMQYQREGWKRDQLCNRGAKDFEKKANDGRK